LISKHTSKSYQNFYKKELSFYEECNAHYASLSVKYPKDIWYMEEGWSFALNKIDYDFGEKATVIKFNKE
jgi:hypothetical protein